MEEESERPREVPAVLQAIWHVMKKIYFFVKCAFLTSFAASPAKPLRRGCTADVVVAAALRLLLPGCCRSS